MSDSNDRTPYSGEVKRIELRVEGTPDSGHLTVRFLGDVRGTVGHWPKGVKGFQPCPGPNCVHHKTPLQWMGFAAAERQVAGPPVHWIPCLIDVTERLFRTLGAEALRGTQWRLFKKPCGRKSMECTGEQVGDVDPRLLRREPTVEQIVERMYRVRPMQWGMLPLWEDATYLEVIESEPVNLVPKVDPLGGFEYVRPRKGMTFDQVAEDYARARDEFLSKTKKKDGEE